MPDIDLSGSVLNILSMSPEGDRKSPGDTAKDFCIMCASGCQGCGKECQFCPGACAICKGCGLSLVLQLGG